MQVLLLVGPIDLHTKQILAAKSRAAGICEEYTELVDQIIGFWNNLHPSILRCVYRDVLANEYNYDYWNCVVFNNTKLEDYTNPYHVFMTAYDNLILSELDIYCKELIA